MKTSLPSTSSESGGFSTEALGRVIEALKNKQNRNSTIKMYLSVWRQFNKFLLKLDERPDGPDA